MIWVTFLMAVHEVRRNALRSFLTMLGVVIGVGSVIALVTIGQGATAQVQASVGAMGDKLLMIRPGADRHGPAPTTSAPFETADIEAIRREVRGLEALSGTTSSSATVVFGNQSWSPSISGADNDLLKIRGYKLESGRQFTESELKSGTPVCILGQTVKTSLFPSGSPVGQRIRVGRVSCVVVGVLVAKGQAAMGPDQDDIVLMPLIAAQRRLTGNTKVSMAYATVATGHTIASVKAQIEALLRERRRIQPGSEDDFTVRDLQEIAQAMSSVTSTLTGLLGGIAAVSLLVGGIGIMNIMLVSVTERTREIGTRLAIGALGSEVLWQFLVEAVVLSTMGGLIGIGFGLGLSLAASHFLAVPFIVAPGITVGAFAFSAVVGIVFGFLPARKAARLNPIEALRHE